MAGYQTWISPHREPGHHLRCLRTGEDPATPSPTEGRSIKWEVDARHLLPLGSAKQDTGYYRALRSLPLTPTLSLYTENITTRTLGDVPIHNGQSADPGSQRRRRRRSRPTPRAPHIASLSSQQVQTRRCPGYTRTRVETRGVRWVVPGLHYYIHLLVCISVMLMNAFSRECKRR